MKNIEGRCRYLSDYLKEGLKKINGVTLLSGKSPNLSAPGYYFRKERNWMPLPLLIYLKKE